LPANDPDLFSAFRISGASIMQKMTILAVASIFAAAPALADNPPAATGAAHPARPAGVTPHPAPAKQAAPASTPEQRSAAALALTHEPTYDEGTVQRIREAAFSYSDIAVRGGWPEIPAEAKFAVGVAGQHDDLLRKRLLISGDLADDKGTGAHDEIVVEALKRFQSRHGLAPTGTMTPRTLAALNVSVHRRIMHFRNDVYAQDEHLLEATAEEAAFLNKAADHPLSAHLVQ
jgi:L,D-transpeptidase YcbB